MPEVVPSDAVWRYDYIEEYNLSKEIISAYLKTIWGNYKFFVEVSPVSGTGSFPRSDSLQRHGDYFRFWVPRRLKRVFAIPRPGNLYAVSDF